MGKYRLSFEKVVTESKSNEPPIVQRLLQTQEVVVGVGLK